MHVGKCAFVLTLVVSLFGCDDKKDTSTSSSVPSASSSTSVATASDAPPAPAAPAATGDLIQIACQHILVAYKGAKGAQGSILRSKADAKKRADEIDAKAKAGEDFSALAQQFSDDLGTRDRQGNLGKFGRSKMVPQFADAAFALAVDEVSGVVETPFGYHIIKRNQ